MSFHMLKWINFGLLLVFFYTHSSIGDPTICITVGWTALLSEPTDWRRRNLFSLEGGSITWEEKRSSKLFQWLHLSIGVPVQCTESGIVSCFLTIWIKHKHIPSMTCNKTKLISYVDLQSDTGILHSFRNFIVLCLKSGIVSAILKRWIFNV